MVGRKCTGTVVLLKEEIKAEPRALQFGVPEMLGWKNGDTLSALQFATASRSKPSDVALARQDPKKAVGKN
jgi:hypothetical protein